MLDLPKSQGVIESRIDILADGFGKVGNAKEIPEGDPILGWEGYVLPVDGNMDHTHSKISERGEKENEERPKGREEKIKSPRS